MLLVAGFEVQDCWPAHGQGQLHGFTHDAASDEKFCAEMEVSVDHVHIFCSFPPRYSPRPPRAISQVVGRLKNLSARAVFKEFPWVKRKRWGGELWEDGYFARTVGDKVTAEVIRQYI